MTRGDRIKKRRQDLGISQVELASRIGESKQTIYKYETGIVTNIPLPNVEKIAEVLEVTPEWICWGDDEPAPKESELDEELIQMLLQLKPEDIPLVKAYIQGLQARHAT